MYEFDLRQPVALLTGEPGHIIGRTEHAHGPIQYLVSLGDGRMFWCFGDILNARGDVAGFFVREARKRRL